MGCGVQGAPGPSRLDYGHFAIAVARAFQHVVARLVCAHHARSLVVFGFGRLDRFLAMCVANKLRLVDQKLLDWQLSVQKIRHQPHHDPYCHLFALLKAGATQITQPEQYGFEVLPSCRDMTLVALRDRIDEEFWILSAAHYDRYIATGDLFADEPPQEALW